MDPAPKVETEEGFIAFNRNRRGWECATDGVPADKLVDALQRAKVRRVGPPLEDASAHEAAIAAGKERPDDAYVDVDAEVNSQVAEAEAAVQALVESGTLGDGKLTVSIKGFANPGNEVPEGHAADHITISVGQVTPVAADVQAELDGAQGEGE